MGALNHIPIDKQIYCKRFYRSFEISKHAQSGDCWMIIKQHVLDLSNLTRMMSETNDNTIVSIERMISTRI